MFWLLGYFSPRKLSKKSSWLKHQLRRPAEYAASATGKFDAPPSRQSLLSSVRSHFRRNNLLPLFFDLGFLMQKNVTEKTGDGQQTSRKLNFLRLSARLDTLQRRRRATTAKQNSVRNEVWVGPEGTMRAPVSDARQRSFNYSTEGNSVQREPPTGSE